MRVCLFAVLTSFAVSVLFGQPLAVESNTITLTVTKSVTLGAADVTFSLNIVGGLNSTLEQALSAVKDLGLTAQDLVNIGTTPYGPYPDQTRLTYTFRLVVPFAKMKETLEALDKVRRTIDTNLELQFYGVMVTASQAAADGARQTAIRDLIQEARQKAQSLADAAQMKLGPVMALSEQTYLGTGPPGLTVYFSVTVRFAAEPPSGP